jgi:hypothetical protein
MFLTTGRESYSDVLISVDIMSNKDDFSLFMDFRESLTLAMLQSGLNTLYSFTRRVSDDSCSRKDESGTHHGSLED